MNDCTVVTKKKGPIQKLSQEEKRASDLDRYRKNRKEKMERKYGGSWPVQPNDEDTGLSNDDA